MRFRKLLFSFFMLVMIATPFVAYEQRNNIYDWYRLYNYSAPDNIAKLATDTTMLPKTRRIFYVNYPELKDKTSFNDNCRTDEQSIVLGCYVQNRGIYLLSVTDSRLYGVEQVTAAHETLHAVYARLSSTERKKVNAMTQLAFNLITDKRIKDNIELYRKKDPSVVPNELHSILGTEVKVLPEELETYYSMYFSDRSKIVGYLEQYEQAFTERKKQVKAYDEQLVVLNKEIKDLQSSLATQSSNLNAQRNRLDSLRSSNQINPYNAAVPGYNLAVNQYNSGVDKLSTLVDQYNAIVPKRNEIASEESELAKAIDSRASVPARQ